MTLQKWDERAISIFTACWLLFVASCASESTQGQDGAGGAGEKSYANIHDVFSAYDNDGNGYLDPQEYFQLQNDPFIVKSRQKIPEMQRSPLIFEEIDENMDNQISLEELTAIIFPVLPMNGDGHANETKK